MLPNLFAALTTPAKDKLTLSHVGDGNVHSILLFTNDDELHRIEEGVHEMVHRAIRLDGTCTGEHGVGLGKIEYLTEELGLGTVNLMETVKRTSTSIFLCRHSASRGTLSDALEVIGWAESGQRHIRMLAGAMTSLLI
jgi:hypothetical protein